MSWVVAQLGARENYAIARSLQREGVLNALITDVWAGPNSVMGRLSKRLEDRYHPDLEQARVIAPTMRYAVREAFGKFSKRSGWDQIMHRNIWFQNMVVRRLNALNIDERSVVFAYSYAAENILKSAKEKGALTLLGQIDPGLAEAKQIGAVYAAAGQAFETPPQAYWDAWKRETELADIIVVNSDWSRAGLISEGVPSDKIRVLPLAFDGKGEGRHRQSVSEFTEGSPLQLLFLGQVNLRKGIDLLFDAMLALPGLPLQLDVVGPVQVAIPEGITKDPRIKIHGSVPRSDVTTFYRQADLFMFPTRSDGFGLTQLEALAAGVPVVASSCCGAVVNHGVNGLLLDELTSDHISKTLRQLQADPSLVSDLQDGAVLSAEYGLDKLGPSLQRIAESRPT